MGDADNKRRAMESEMDRFEAEISSLTRQPNFIPAQLRRHPAPVNIPVPTPPVIAAAPVITRPAAPAVIRYELLFSDTITGKVVNRVLRLIIFYC